MSKERLKKVMTNTGLVVYEKTTPMTLRFTTEETDKLFKRKIDYDRYDEHCEIAHLEISNECNMDCKYCYVGKKEGKILTTAAWRSIIDKLVDYGIFQITFGGGEPTLYDGFFQLAGYANSRGLNVAMTSNGGLIPMFSGEALRLNFKQINISWHQNFGTVKTALNYLNTYNVKAGINYCYSKEMAKDNVTVKALAKTYNAELLYLAYKPVIGDKDNIIAPSDVYKTAKKAANEGLKVAVDGPCVGLCMMKKRFVDINSMGFVFPCSFIRKPMGNLLTQSFKEIWDNRGPQEPCPYLEIERRNTDVE